MSYVIGIDSGGTKYLVKAYSLDGKILAAYTGVPAGLYRFTEEEAFVNIEKNLNCCLRKAGLIRSDCDFIVCGTTGIDSGEDKQQVENLYFKLSQFNCPVICVNDAEVAQYALTGGIGAIVIAGTGSIAFGRNAFGMTTRSGGWPPCIFGDEGSGTWFVHQALHHISMVLDGRSPETVLFQLLNEELKICRRKDLLRICEKIERMEWKNERIPLIINQAAQLSDLYAHQMLEQAANLTFELADSVVKKLQLNQQPVFKVGAWGSAIIKSSIHFEQFKKRFEEKYSNADVVVSDKDAADGACQIALDLYHKKCRWYHVPKKGGLN